MAAHNFERDMLDQLLAHINGCEVEVMSITSSASIDRCAEIDIRIMVYGRGTSGSTLVDALRGKTDVTLLLRALSRALEELGDAVVIRPNDPPDKPVVVKEVPDGSGMATVFYTE